MLPGCTSLVKARVQYACKHKHAPINARHEPRRIFELSMTFRISKLRRNNLETITYVPHVSCNT